ncbi:hypothetical protein [Streptomyces sp. NPDC020917]|uniref:hypothetical protein n=1 Tax=Streptomyces sp. NPDC020917 TaxID=3365102 RepID=UPI0037951D0B
MPSTNTDERQPCELCEQREDCSVCDGSGEATYPYDECFECSGTGVVIPEHCCDCGGSPYCQCCTTCGNYAGTCGCTVTVTLLDGTTKPL